MEEVFKKFLHQISMVTASATFSPASASGPTRSALPVGKTLDLFGPDPARASRSPAQGSNSGQPTSATSGPRGSGSSVSADLQRSLASRLQTGCPCLV